MEMRWYLFLGVVLALCLTFGLGQKENEDLKTVPVIDEKVKAEPSPEKSAERGKTPNKPSGGGSPGVIGTNSKSGKTGGDDGLTAKPSMPETENPTTLETEAAVEILTKKAGLGGLKEARILVMLPMPFYSHTNNYVPIFKALAKRGHKITMVSPFPQKEPLANWEDIVTENVMDKIWAKMASKDITEMNTSFLSKVIGLVAFADLMVEMFVVMEPVQQLYKDESREFDLVFVEAQFVQEPLLAFGWKYKAPVISLYPSYIVPEVAYYTGNPVFTTNYVPSMHFDASNNMNFYQRFENTAYAFLKIIMYNSYYLPRMESYMNKYFPSPDRPYIADLLFNVSFTLMDSNPVLVYPYPRVNNIREFLGINTKREAPLDPELQEIMDGADKDGVLLFTLGSTFPLSMLKPNVIAALMYAFSKIPQKVIMKWDKDEPPPNMPSNVHLAKWLPQSGILSHKNCRAFFTHTGVHGLMEAMDFGVPTISLPLFADQQFFATWAVLNGVGKKLDLKTLTPESTYATVHEVLNDPKYKENSVAVSIKIRDVPQPTIDEVVYWVEHVLRTKGARHLRPGSLNLWWYQRFGLDVLAVALALILVPIWLLVAIIRRMSRRNSNNADTDRKRMKSKKEN